MYICIKCKINPPKTHFCCSRKWEIWGQDQQQKAAVLCHAICQLLTCQLAMMHGKSYNKRPSLQACKDCSKFNAGLHNV